MTSASPNPLAPLALLHRLDAHDRALFTRWARRDTQHGTPGGTHGGTHGGTRGDRHTDAGARLWRLVTHLGGATTTLALAIVPLAASGTLRTAAWHALLTLVLSHLVVHCVKRHVGRPRP